MDPIHLHIFWTYSGSRLSKLTRAATGGDRWTHVGLYFVFPCGRIEAFEARSKTGWTGPYDYRDTIDYVRRMGGQHFESHPLPLTPDAVTNAYAQAIAQLETKGYPKWQLVNYYLHKGHPWIPMIPSPNHLICSEGVANCISGRECLNPLPPLKHYQNTDGLSPTDLYNDHTQMVSASHNHKPNLTGAR